jgi:hypothetical protein
MKVEINKKEEVRKPIKYPCLMLSVTNNIVYMVKESKGVLILKDKNSDISTKQGEYHDEWLMELFTPFNDSITLSND